MEQSPECPQKLNIFCNPVIIKLFNKTTFPQRLFMQERHPFPITLINPKSPHCMHNNHSISIQVVVLLSMSNYHHPWTSLYGSQWRKITCSKSIYHRANGMFATKQRLFTAMKRRPLGPLGSCLRVLIELPSSAARRRAL